MKIEIQDQQVKAALQALAERVSNMAPTLKAIGEQLAERAADRFGTGVGPDGRRWLANARATIENFIAARRGFGAKGINKKGRDLAISKKPLVATGELAHSIRFQMIGNHAVEIGTNRFADRITNGAAIHQFGGQAGRGHKVTIPARPFLPITAAGELTAGDKALVLEALNDYLAGR